MKHLLLSAFLLLFAVNISAQLRVQPNSVTNADSYIFVDNEILYVKEGIHLEENSEGVTNASIYLRNEGQLIQGNNATPNSGDGKLSVYQTSNGNSYHYTYWASPVGDPDSNPSGNTNFGITKIYDVQAGSETHSIQAAHTSAHNSIASPLTIARGWIYTMRATSTYSSWIPIQAADGIEAGEGFTMRGTGVGNGVNHYQLWDFRGRPNNGEMSNGVMLDQYTLVGNPYPSAMDMAVFFNNNPHIEATAWYWDQDREINSHYLTEIAGGYGTWVPEGGDVLTPAEGDGTSGVYTHAIFSKYDGYGNNTNIDPEDLDAGDTYQRRFAPIGQGFLVRGIQNGNVSIDNTMRVYVKKGVDNFSQFRGMGDYGNNKNNNTNDDYDAADPTTIAGQHSLPMLRFHTTVRSNYVRDMVLMFSDASTKAKDRGFDGKAPSIVSTGDIYWNLENEADPYVIQTRPFDMQDKIPLGLKGGNNGTHFTLEIVEKHHFNKKIYLWDSLLNTYQPLHGQSKAHITIDVNTQLEGRFFLTFEKTYPSYDKKKEGEALAEKVNFFQNNRAGQLEVYNPDALEIKNAAVYDMRGRLVISERNLGNAARFTFPTANLSDGMYLVKLTTAQDIEIDYKAMVSNKN